MSNYSSLKATINANIKTNGNQEITGAVLNSVLRAMTDTLGAGYQYMGIAIPSTSPGTPDAKVFYLAATAGTYTNFENLVVADGEVVILRWDSSWHKDVTGMATLAKLSKLQFTIDGAVSENVDGRLRKNGFANFNLIAGRKYTFTAKLAASISNTLNFEIRDANGVTRHSGAISAGSTQNSVTFVETTNYENCYFSCYSGTSYDATIELTTISLAEQVGAIDNLVPGDMSPITSNMVARSLFEIFNLPYQVLGNATTSQNYALLPSGLCVSNSDAQLKKYPVQEGRYLYLDLSKDNDSVYQFQRAASVPASGINNNLVDKSIANPARGVVRVPQGATYLIISQNKTNITNVVAELADFADTIVSRLSGNTEFSFDFGTGAVTQYSSRTYMYPIVSGHMYKVEIETTNNTDTTYFSTRLDASHTVQTDLGFGIGSRSFQFRATGDAPMVALSYRYAGSGAIFNIQITDLDSVSVYGNYYKIEDLESRIGGGIAMPEYSQDEQKRLYDLLTERSKKDIHIAAFNTDQHINIDNDTSTSSYNPKWVMQGVQALINIANLLPVDEIVFGGDAPGYGGAGTSFDAVGILQTINYLLEPTHDVNSVVISIPGNHDAFQNNASVTAQGMYNVHAKRNQRHLYYHGNGVDNCDAYVDDTEHKIRSIYLDTCSRNIRVEQFRDFLTSALSTLPEDYMALIFSHFPLTNEFAGTILAQKISDPSVEIDAFQDPADCHAILDQYAEKIIACISGHTHFDAFGISPAGILYIETTTAAPHTRNYTTENIPNTSTLGTITDTSFDFFIIDQSEKTIEALRYGQGCNRKWVYKGNDIGQVAGYPQTIVR